VDAGLVILTPIYLRVVPVWVEATEGLSATELDEGARSCGWPRPMIAHSRGARAAHVRGQHRLAFRHVLAHGNSTGLHCARFPAVFAIITDAVAFVVLLGRSAGATASELRRRGMTAKIRCRADHQQLLQPDRDLAGALSGPACVGQAERRTPGC
jgi:hypothetical protein